MAENTKIEWCDHTINWWIGCTKVSPACAHCYAETLDHRFGHESHWGPDAPRAVRIPPATREAFRYQRRAEKEGRRFRVFTNSLSDFFEDRADLDEPRLEALDVMRRTPALDWLILTKRPERILDLLLRAERDTERTSMSDWLRMWLGMGFPSRNPPANVWLGTTVEDQERADQRIPALLRVPAAVRFLSCEPLLGPVDLTAIKHTASPGYFGDCLQWHHRPNGAGPWPSIHWVICGGESGPHPRPMHPDWARGLRDQCAAAGVPFLLKQWGEWGLRDDGLYVTNDDRCQVVGPEGLMGRPWLGWGRPEHPERTVMHRFGKHRTGRLLDGVEHNGFPEVRR